MTSADRPEGPWAPLHPVLRAAGWDDCAPFWDDDGKGYFIGTNFSDGYKIHLWELSADNKNLIPASDRVIYQSKGSEANKLYKINGTYFHLFSEVRGDLRVMMMRRATSIRGPWSDKRQLTATASPCSRTRARLSRARTRTGISSPIMATAIGRAGQRACCRFIGSMAGR
jgi:beta-xylosidase